MAAETFVGSASGSSTAVATWTHPSSFMSDQGNFRVRSLGNGLFTLYRLISTVWTEIDGGSLTGAEVQALWYLLTNESLDLGGTPYLATQVSSVPNATTWKTTTVAGATTLYRYYSSAYHTISGGTLTKAQLLELRDLLLMVAT